MTIIALVGLLASVLVGLKNSAGQPLVSTGIANIITTGETLVTSIVADVHQAGATGATSPPAVADDLATIQALLTVLKAQKVISAQTLSQITALDKALAEALQAEQDAQKSTDPSNLATPIPPAV